MRLWTLHPRYLDAAGLVALWREALLAKAVLRGRTDGYRHHPQLERFRATADPVGAVNAYLHAVHAEADRRGYRFNAQKLRGQKSRSPITATRGQLAFEWSHLLGKLRRRSPAQYSDLRTVARPQPHPQFLLRAGRIAGWEKNARGPGR
jgi:hypothetical protein